ncbi:unnamed protein product, partial [Nesidiocoris tenuis]
MRHIGKGWKLLRYLNHLVLRARKLERAAWSAEAGRIGLHVRLEEEQSVKN